MHPSMLIILSWFSLLIITSTSYASTSTSTSTGMVMIGPFGQQKQHHHSCGYARYPDLCVQTLATTTLLHPSKNISTLDVMSALLNITISESKLPVSNFEVLSSHFISSQAQSARFSLGTHTYIHKYKYIYICMININYVKDYICIFAAGYCHELMEMAVKRLNQAMVAMKESPRKNKHDIQTWISAALTYHEVCKDGVDVHAITNEYLDQVSKKMEYLAKLGSNSLALVNRITSSSTGVRGGRGLGRRLVAEFPEWVPENHRKLLQQSTPTIRANAVVAKDGTGNYKTISDAIKAASGGRFVIYVKSGVYSEKIHCNKDGITLIGDGKYSTVITGDDSVNGGSSLQASATFSQFSLLSASIKNINISQKIKHKIFIIKHE